MNRVVDCRRHTQLVERAVQDPTSRCMRPEGEPFKVLVYAWSLTQEEDGVRDRTLTLYDRVAVEARACTITDGARLALLVHDGTGYGQGAETTGLAVSYHPFGSYPSQYSRLPIRTTEQNVPCSSTPVTLSGPKGHN